MVDLTGIDGQYEDTDNHYKRRNEEDAGINDVADRLFSTDFQSTSCDALDIPFKKVFVSSVSTVSFLLFLTVGMQTKC